MHVVFSVLVQRSGFAASVSCVHADQEVLIGTLLDLLPSLSLFRSLSR